MRSEFSYFTVLTYWGLGFYFLFSSLHTLTYCLTGSPLLARWPRFLQTLHRFYYTTICIMPVIVTIVYWGIIYDGDWFPTVFQAWENVSQHAMNLCFASFEIFIPRTPVAPAVHIVFVTVVMLLYVALAYMTNATVHFYPYSFLDPGPNGAGSTAKVGGYIIGIWVAFIVVFFIYRGIVWGRIWVTEKKLGMTGKFSARDQRVDMRTPTPGVGIVATEVKEVV